MIVSVKDLGYSYGKTPIIDHVNFEARPGEITTVIGANGAGKTTMLKCIAGLFHHRGTVEFDGESMNFQKSAEFISYMEQNTDCDIELNVFEIVLLGMVGSLSYSVDKETIAKVEGILSEMGLMKFADRKIGELSGGQRQLVFIAQALVKDPKVLILDEPTSALDLYHQFGLISFIKKVTKERGCTTIMTLHHLDVALKYSDQVVVVNSGGLYQVGPSEEVFTEKMLFDVYSVFSKFEVDDKGVKHLIVLGPKDEIGGLEY